MLEKKYQVQDLLSSKGWLVVKGIMEDTYKGVMGKIISDDDTNELFRAQGAVFFYKRVMKEVEVINEFKEETVDG